MSYDLHNCEIKKTCFDNIFAIRKPPAAFKTIDFAIDEDTKKTVWYKITNSN